MSGNYRHGTLYPASSAVIGGKTVFCNGLFANSFFAKLPEVTVDGTPHYIGQNKGNRDDHCYQRGHGLWHHRETLADNNLTSLLYTTFGSGDRKVSHQSDSLGLSDIHMFTLIRRMEIG